MKYKITITALISVFISIATAQNQPAGTDALQKATEGAGRHTYAQSSVLAQGKFVKIRISESGVYKLTYENLNSMGISPANVRIFGYGGAVLEQSFLAPKIDDLPEVAIWMEKGADGVFNAGDYILFYGQGVVKWGYNNIRKMFTHTINPYSRYGYYFVTSDAGTGKKIETKENNTPADATVIPVEEFTDYQVHELDNNYVIESGREFYGEDFNEKTSYNFTFNFPNAVQTTNSTITRLDVIASAFAISSFSLNLNGGQTKILPVGQRIQGETYEQAKAASDVFSFTPQSDVFTFNLIYSKPTLSAVGYLNFLEVNARRKLKMSGSVMQFQNIDNMGTANYNQYMLSDANNNVQIWDITDQQNICKMPAQTINNKLTFTATGNEIRKYLAIDPTAKNAFLTPEVEGIVGNQNLHGINQADLVIITHPNFLTQAQRLAQAHREKDYLTAEVVTTEQVYNEFSSGTPDATSYRWIMKMLYDRATTETNQPKYLLLFGRGSYDNKKIFSNSADNFILTYQAENSISTTASYVTDDYFGVLSDNQGAQLVSDSLKLGVGRLPVATSQQATNVVNKIIGYMENKNKGNWKNQLCFIADDDNNKLHMEQANGIADTLIRRHPSFQINKIYLDAYPQEISASGETYPVAKNKFINLLHSGLFYLNYTGHAGPTGWTNESMLSLADTKTMSNENLPFVMAATCDFLQFDTEKVSGGEQMLLNPVGGCIGILSAARPVYATQNLALNKQISENLLKKSNGKHRRLGDIIAASKNRLGADSNKLAYIFMGDPALRLNYPTEFNIVTDSINGNLVSNNDTLRALSVATIKGYIADENGKKATDFNGTLRTVVYDKVQTINTLNNDGGGIFTYSDRPNTLFSGKTEVVGGRFSFSFMLPKDIKYNYGAGRINYYAADDKNNFEAQGYFEKFAIGGTNKNYINEKDGPEVKMYLNSENFVSGNKVNETPMFIADVSDLNGINTVGSGIGHDVMLTIDEDAAQSYILNDYFQATENSYKNGIIKYKLAELADGKHTLTFRVWDLLNNSTTKTIDFEVQKSLTPVIFSVHNYPNPVTTGTNIIVDHDRPETILNTTVEIFDLAGRKVWSFSQPSANNITWNLDTTDGRKVKTGIYLYRVTIKTVNSDGYSKTNKMLIVEQ